MTEAVVFGQNGSGQNGSGQIGIGQTGMVRATIGFASETGKRPRNEDFVGAVSGDALPDKRGDVVAALADGIGGAKGGRVAAETAVRGFLDGWWDMPETMEPRRAASRVLDALNSWINTLGRSDPELAGMGCTFTAVVLRGRVAHLVHAGDSRAYRFSGERLTRLTTDHVRLGDKHRPLLVRAVGIEPELRLDYLAQPVTLHDRLILCTDGVHGSVGEETMAEILRARSAPGEAAHELVMAALDAESRDNCTALVLDITGLPSAESADIGDAIAQLPLIAVPRGGETIDGFVLKVLLSDGRYSRLFGATDDIEGGDVALKFPKPAVAAVATYHAAFVREAWVGARINSPGVARVIALPPGRQTSLYTVMPLYLGELLEGRLTRYPSMGLEEGRNIALRLCRAVAALHRIGVIHRDIKPDNIILEAGGTLKLLDLGVVRVPGMEDFPPENIPGTAAYMAPEMFAGEPGNEATDIYALGVTLFRAYTTAYPYGNLDAVSRPTLERPRELTSLRPDLPAWLQAALARAMAPDPRDRFGDVQEFAQEMEAGPSRAPSLYERPRTLYERAPLQFWQGVAGLLALALALSMLRH